MRYALAALGLLPLALRSGQLKPLRRASAGLWLRLIALGLLYYAVTQSAQFLSLAYLPSVTVSLMLSFSTILVAWLGVGLLRERPTMTQWAGIGLYGIGVLVFFYPLSSLQGQPIGYVVAGIGVLRNQASSTTLCSFRSPCWPGSFSASG